MIVKKFLIVVVLVVLVVVMVMLVVVEVDFIGKMIEWVILFLEIGGLVKWVNFFVLFLVEELLGNLIVVVKFMLGVGLIKGVNWFQE